jgi:hypothetical protein
MTEISKSEAVKITYKDDKISITGPSVNGVLEITSKELKNLYWKGAGNGTVHVKIKNT